MLKKEKKTVIGETLLSYLKESVDILCKFQNRAAALYRLPAHHTQGANSDTHLQFMPFQCEQRGKMQHPTL